MNSVEYRQLNRLWALLADKKLWRAKDHKPAFQAALDAHVAHLNTVLPPHLSLTYGWREPEPFADQFLPLDTSGPLNDVFVQLSFLQGTVACRFAMDTSTLDGWALNLKCAGCESFHEDRAKANGFCLNCHLAVPFRDDPFMRPNRLYGMEDDTPPLTEASMLEEFFTRLLAPHLNPMETVLLAAQAGREAHGAIQRLMEALLEILEEEAALPFPAEATKRDQEIHFSKLNTSDKFNPRIPF